MTDWDVICYGTVVIDYVWQMAELPKPDGWMPISGEKRMIGGEASNTAIALSKWGASVALMGSALGTDPEGEFLRKSFAEEAPALDLSLQPFSDEVKTPFCACLATDDGLRTMFGSGDTALFPPVLTPEIASRARYVTADPNKWELSMEALFTASKAGAKVVAMDFMRSEEVCREAHISITSHAEDEKGSYAGFARKMRDRYGKSFIVTAGAEGSYVAEEEKSGDAVHIAVLKLDKVVDSTGAGDIYRAGILFGEIQGWNLIKSARFASIAAAHNCLALGGWGGVAPLRQLLERLDQDPDSIGQ